MQKNSDIIKLKKIFPSFAKFNCSYFNLNTEAKNLTEKNILSSDDFIHSLISAEKAQMMVDYLHSINKSHWSYGGYLEERSFILEGSYLKSEQKYLHLGIDINVPCGTPVHSPCSLKITLIDDERDLNGGWGPRVIAEILDNLAETKCYLIFGHLQNITISEGQIITAGSAFAEIGDAPDNGNWWPHLHLQAIDPLFYKNQILEDINKLDGYAKLTEIEQVRLNYPNPLDCIDI